MNVLIHYSVGDLILIFSLWYWFQLADHRFWHFCSFSQYFILNLKWYMSIYFHYKLICPFVLFFINYFCVFAIFQAYLIVHFWKWKKCLQLHCLCLFEMFLILYFSIPFFLFSVLFFLFFSFFIFIFVFLYFLISNNDQY